MKNFDNLIINEGYLNNIDFFSGGNGSSIFLKNKKFIDLSFCNGTLLLGHNSKILRKSLKDIAGQNISVMATPNTQARKFSKIIKKIIPYGNKFVFCNTGTEAITKSLRICRSISKKKLIVSVSGSWHGSVDNLLFIPDKNLKPLPLSAGLSDYNRKNIKFIPYNDIDLSEKIIRKHKKDINCIVVEPIQGCLPMEEAREYLKFLRKISKMYKIPLIFDELITGLRTDGSTLQDYFKIKPDISTFGKCFGGGLPLGIISVSSEIYKKMSKNQKKVFFGGTFSGNSLSCYVGMRTSEYIIKNKKKIFPKLEKVSFHFQNQMNNFFINKNIKAKVYRFKSLLRIVYTDHNVVNRTQRDFFETKNLKRINSLRSYLKDNNIYYPKNGLIFFSDQTSINDVNKVIKVLKKGFLSKF